MNRHIHLLLLLVSSLALGRSLDAANRPNILTILVDDLGYGDLSSHGAGDMETPNIDSLMSQGMRFDNFYANCTVCSPTRASFLTGRYPDLAGVPGVIRTHANNNWGYFDPSIPTLPDLLRNAGYHTALIGKWHLGLESPNLPNERGFDFLHGFLGDMMDDYYDHRRHGNNYMRRNRQTIQPEGHATDLFSNWSAEFIQRRASSDQPWFLYLAYNAPHTPIQPPEDWLKRVQEREAGISPDRAKLVALIEHLDHGIGRVLQALNNSGQSSDTLIVFTSDNGGQLNVGGNNGPYRGGKQDMYEGGIRVPFCVVWPDRIPAGSRSQEVAMTMDLYPTFCEALGIEIDHEINGRSLLAIWTGEVQTLGERTLVWCRREGGGRYQGQDYYAIREGRWKLLHNTPFDALELYDLDKDPAETMDLADTNKEVFNRLAAKLRKHLQRAGSVPWQSAEEE